MMQVSSVLAVQPLSLSGNIVFEMLTIKHAVQERRAPQVGPPNDAYRRKDVCAETKHKG